MNKTVAFGLLMVLLVAMVAEGKSVTNIITDNSVKAGVQPANGTNVGCYKHGRSCQRESDCCPGLYCLYSHRNSGFRWYCDDGRPVGSL